MDNHLSDGKIPYSKDKAEVSEDNLASVRLMGLPYFFEVTRTTVRASVITAATLVAVVPTAIKTLIDIAKRKGSRLRFAVWAISKLLVV